VREAKAMLAPKGHALDWTAFANRWRREYQPAMDAVRSGNHGYVVLDVLHREMPGTHDVQVASSLALADRLGA
jgi:hypothetical protein